MPRHNYDADQMKSEVVYMDPAWAQEILSFTAAHDGEQRRLMPRNLQAIKSDIQNGQWRTTGQPIVLDHLGRVVDGQHRLMAVVETGIAIKVLLVTGASAGHFGYYDQGAMRTVGQVLDMRNPTLGAIGARLRGSMALRCMAWMDNPTGVISSVLYASKQRQYVNRAAIVQYYKDNEVILEWAVQASRGLKSFITPGHAGLCAFAFHVSGNQQAVVERFFTGLREGVYPSGHGLTDKDPVWLLRQRLMQNAITERRQHMLKREEIVWAVFTTWNRWIESRTAGEYLRIPRDAMLPFPKVAVMDPEPLV